MQVFDIKVTPASETDDMSLVRFIGEGGDEVAVTIADPHEGGATINEELVARAKVMLLHAVAAQASNDVPPRDEAEPVAELADDEAAGPHAPDPDASSSGPEEPRSSDNPDNPSEWDVDRTSDRLSG